MLYFYLTFLLLCLLCMKAADKKSFHQDYMSKDNTTAVNGIFVGLVFFSHLSGYMTLADTPSNRLFQVLNIGQLMVTSFLFYSGYGMLCSIRAKGLPYVRKIPFARVFKIWLHFAIAVCLFIAINACIGNKYDAKTVLLSFTGIRAVGNSNWYIFTILMLYLIMFFSFLLARGKLWTGAILVVVLSVGLTALMHLVHLNRSFYDTLLCFPLGVLFALCKEKIEKIVTKNIGIYLASLAGLGLVLWIIWRCMQTIGGLAYPFFASCFILIVVLLTMKIRLKNPMLDFLGTHVFEIYILQRLPMIVLDHFGWSQQHPYLYFLICAVVTIILAIVFQKGMLWIDNAIYKKKQRA